MYLFRVLAIVTGIALTVAVSVAQQPTTPTTGGGGGTGGAPGGSTTGTSGSNTSGGRPTAGTNPDSRTNTNSPFPNEISRPIFLSGRVVLSDGTALPEPAIIERVCNGAPHSEAHTDSKGRFSFQLGQSQEVFMDLSDPLPAGLRGFSTGGIPAGGIRGSDLANCDLRAALAGFRSDLVSLANHRSLDNPDVGTIVLHRIGNVAGLTTSAISARAPKDARKAYEKGLEDAKKGKSDEAQKQFEKAIDAYPKYALAWFELGRVHEQQNRVDDARKAYAQALEADSHYVTPYERLYMLAFKERNWQELADTTERIIHLNPYEFPGAYYFNGVANLELGKLNLAEKSAREAVKLDTTHRNPRTIYVLGLILARKQDFAESSEYLRAYLKAAPNASDAEVVRKQLVQVENYAQAKAQPQP